MMAFKLLRKQLNSCLGNYSYEQMTVRFLFTMLNWLLILISLSYHKNRKQPTSGYETVMQRTSLARMALKIWICAFFLKQLKY